MINSKRTMVLCVVVALFGSMVIGSENPYFKHVMNIGTEGTGEAQFKYVEDFDFSSDGKLIYATDAAHAWVQVFDKTTGKYIARFGGKGDEDHHLDKPEGIAVAPNGNIFVADYNTGYVKVYDKAYKWLFTFSDYGSEPGENIKSEFCSIYDGKFIMPEAGNHRINVWDLKGNFLYTFSQKGSAPGELNNPEAAKVNSKGELVVADLKNDRIQVFTVDGKLLRGWGTTGTALGQMKAPAGIGIDKDDNIYVTEIGNDRIQVFTAAGDFITAWGTKGSADGQFGNTHGMIVDRSTGWVYIADTANNRIQVYKPSGIQLATDPSVKKY